PTMIFYMKDGKPPVRRTILHEFGHALGLLHEHQDPARPFRFNETKVMMDMKQDKFCDDINNQGKLEYIGDVLCLERIRVFITEPPTTAEICPGAPEYDEKSIMHYDIRKGWIREFPDKEIIAKSTLSSIDTLCARGMYPTKNQTPEDQSKT